jgi:hypothetical protein
VALLELVVLEVAQQALPDQAVAQGAMVMSDLTPLHAAVVVAAARLVTQVMAAMGVPLARVVRVPEVAVVVVAVSLLAGVVAVVAVQAH